MGEYSEGHWLQPNNLVIKRCFGALHMMTGILIRSGGRLCPNKVMENLHNGAVLLPRYRRTMPGDGQDYKGYQGKGYEIRPFDL